MARHSCVNVNCPDCRARILRVNEEIRLETVEKLLEAAAMLEEGGIENIVNSFGAATGAYASLRMLAEYAMDEDRKRRDRDEYCGICGNLECDHPAVNSAGYRNHDRQ